MVTEVDERRDRFLQNAFAYAGEFDDHKPATLLLNQAHGWLKNAEWTVRSAPFDKQPAGVWHLIPAMFALYHGIELFLKGVTHELTGSYDGCHDLEALAKSYDAAITASGRRELAIKADIQRFVQWDQACRRSSGRGRAPNGSDFRFVLDLENKPYWPGISIRLQDLIDWSREYRRDFSRIRRVLFDVKGWGHFWDEGTFASEYPHQPFWFFCVCCRSFSDRRQQQWEHWIVDEKGREWHVYEGEAIHETNHYIKSVGRLPRPHRRVESSLKDLPKKLSEIQ